MSITLDEFIESVTTSGLMDTEDIQSFIATLPMEQHPKTAEDLARELYRQGKLTKFQAQAIYQKKTRGLVVGNYVVLDKLGKGGMGAVYKAQHKRMKRIVALKMLPSSATKSSDSVKRFQREVEAAAKLTHPNIVTAHDADEAKGVHFLVMEYVEGQDLHALVKEHGTISAPRAVDYMVQAATGLEYAHSQGVIHRDIKPHNLLLDKAGTVKILDMGLARIEEAAGSSDATANEGLTQSGQVMGTLDYMPPEQALDTSTVDVRADIYSLGCTLHYLLIGRPPYSGDTVGKKIVAHREQPVPSLHKLCSDVPQSLDAVFQKMLAKKPEDRQQSMTEVIAQLQACVLPQGSMLAAPSFPPSSASYAETIDIEREETASPAPLSSPLDELFASEPIQITERLVTTRRRIPRKLTKQHKVLVAVMAGTAFLVVLLGVIIKMRTPEGTLVVEIDQPDATVQVLNEQGKVLIERKGQKGNLTIAVDPGKRRLRVEKDGFEVFAKELTIASGGKETITAKLEPKPDIVDVPSVQPSSATPPVSLDKPVEPSPSVVAGSETSPPFAVAPFDATKAKQHQEAWAKYLGIPVVATTSLGMQLILIPPGEFDMGSTPEEIAAEIERAKNNKEDSWYFDLAPREGPRHHVKITEPFYLAVYEVTQAEYENVVGSNPSHSKGDVRQPVEQVSWFDAVAFCNRLSEREQILPYYRIDGEAVSVVGGNGYRLPTEAEWEHACRAGTTTTWSFGDDESMLGDYAWYKVNSGGKVHRVGEKKPNPWGLCDMHGNVSEWCWDWLQPYEAKSVKGPMGPSEGPGRVLRGGAFNNRNLYSAFRMWEPPEVRRRPAFGFRLARTYSRQQPDGKLRGISDTPPSTGTSSPASNGKSHESPQGIEEGFVSLFDGKTLNGWQGATDRYTVQDGKIVVDFGSQPYRGQEGDLFTTKEYRDVVLRLEYTVSPGGNGGILLRAPLGNNARREAIEVQLLDDSAPMNQSIPPDKLNGSLFGIVAVKPGHLNPPGQWNSMEIQWQGRHFKETLNRVVVVDTNLDDNADKTPNGLSHPGLKREQGRLALMGWASVGHLEFRNIRIKELNPASDEGKSQAGEPDHEEKTPNAARTVDSKRPAVELRANDWIGLPQCWRSTRQGIMGSTGTQGIDFNTFLCTKKTYRNFELTSQVRLLTGNTGVQFRSDCVDQGKFILRGPQVDRANAICPNENRL